MAFNLFNKTPDSGAPDANYPEGKYLDKDAGIPGSPVQADMRNDLYIFFSRLFAEVSFTFNDAADTVLSSQFFDAFKNFLEPVLQLKLDTETIEPGNRHINAEIETGSGDANVNLDPGTFEGQTINVTVNDTGLGIVDWGGSYLIYVSLNTALTTSLMATFKWINGVWVVSGGVTAEYVSGTTTIELQSDGGCEFDSVLDVSWAASPTGSVTFSLPVETLNTDYIVLTSPRELAGGQATTMRDLGLKTTTQTQIRCLTISGSSPTAIAKYSTIIKGKYL